MTAVLISDEVWSVLNTLLPAGPTDTSIVMAALAGDRWQCPGCGRIEGAASDSSVVLALHYGRWYRPVNTTSWGASMDPPDPGVWLVTRWQLLRHHPACVTAAIVDATPDSSRTPTDPPREYPAPAAPSATKAYDDRVWTLIVPDADLAVLLWQPELPAPIVHNTGGELRPVHDVHLDILADLGARPWRDFDRDVEQGRRPFLSYGWHSHLAETGAVTICGRGRNLWRPPYGSESVPLPRLSTTPGAAWRDIARTTRHVMVIAAAGGTLDPDLPAAEVWGHPDLVAALRGPVAHMLPLPPMRQATIADFMGDSRDNTMITDLTTPPISTPALAAMAPVENVCPAAEPTLP